MTRGVRPEMWTISEQDREASERDRPLREGSESSHILEDGMLKQQSTGAKKLERSGEQGIDDAADVPRDKRR